MLSSWPLLLNRPYSNEAEIANWYIYDDFKLKKTFGLHGLYKNISALKG